MRIFPQQRVAPIESGPASRLNKLVNIIHSSTGLVANSQTVKSQKLPDGRVKLDVTATAPALATTPPFFCNVEQSYTAFCPEGQVGEYTATIPDGTYCSTISPSDADAQALAAAQAEAEANLVCVPLVLGACCFDDFCEIDTEADCSDFGGVYQGDGTTCDPNPCSCRCASAPNSISATISLTCSGVDGGESCDFQTLTFEGSVDLGPCDTSEFCGGLGTYWPNDDFSGELGCSNSESFDIDCGSTCGSESSALGAVVRLKGSYADCDSWTLIVDTSPPTPICGANFFGLGGDETVMEDLGSSPIGTHVYSFDDPSFDPGVFHWDITVIIS